MRVRNEKELEEVRNAISKLSGPAFYVDTRNGNEFDLKNPDSRRDALSLLLTDYNDRMELFTTRREDTEIMMGLMRTLSCGREHQSIAA